MIALTAFSWARVAVLIILAALLAWYLYEARRHKKTIVQMKWGSWLRAVRDRDIGHDVSAKDPVTAMFLREKFEDGCSPYEAISEWRRRKAEERRPRNNKPTV